MYLAPVNNIQFKGITKYLSCNDKGRDKRVAIYSYGKPYFGDTRGYSDLVKKYSYANAIVEETIGKIHDNITYKVYIADPNEIVTPLIKNTHDYIVYDEEPFFPDANDYNIEKRFEDIHLYLERLEKAELERNNNDINSEGLKIVKDKKNMLAKCLAAFGKGCDLKKEEKETEKTLQKTIQKLSETKINIQRHKIKLEKRIKYNEKMKKSLKNKEKELENWSNIKLNASKKPHNFIQADTINDNIEIIRKKISSTIKIINKNEEIIDFLQNSIKAADIQIPQMEKGIQNHNNKLADIKEALVPCIKSLQDFYKSRGIKIIK